jgi:imidazolonepropionase-like amidohydrolase
MKHGSVSVLAGALAGLLACTPAPSATPAPEQVADSSGAASSPGGVFRTAEEGGRIDNSTTAFPSTYQPLASHPVVIRGATILTATGPALTGASLVLQDGKVTAVGTSVTAPPGAEVIDGTGKWITPGIIDTHSHLGVYAAPGGQSLDDGNEATSPNTAEVWAEHSIWPQDPQFGLALAGGVTTIEILPGSANLIGGRGVVLRNLAATTVQAMKFPNAPYALKMACGENPKRVYGSRGRSPSTRMGNMAGYREAWIRATAYKRRWDKWREEGSDPAKMPDRDLAMETLMGVLDGQIRIQNHCYRADEMAEMVAMSKEFGYHIASFHHAVEAYKIRDLLERENICASMWSDWWGFKLEAYDGIRQNIALMAADGGCAILHTDDPDGIQRMNQDAAKALQAGLEAGLKLTEADAIKWITINPAKALGLEGEVGSLEPGKRADVVIWSADPFSIYSHAEKVYLDGALVYDRADPARQPITDFMLGQPEAGR